MRTDLMNESPQFTKALLSKSEAGKEQRKRLAAIICEELEIANVAMGSLPDRWKALEAMYRNELAKSARKATNKPDEVRLHFPLVQPKIDVLCGRVLDPIFGNDPFLVAKSRGPDQDPATVIQRDVHTLLEIAGFERVARTVTPIVGVTGQAYVRVTSDLQASGRGTLDWQASVTSLGPIAYAGLKLEGIHPAAMRIYPAEVDNLWAAKTLAHLAPPMRVREIREMQEIGRYFNDFQDWRGGDDYGAMEIGRSQSQDLTSTVQAQAQDDQIVATMAGLRKMSIDGEPERWWEFEVAVTDEELLAFREYQLPQPWYVQLSFFQEVGSVIRSNSVANNLQHLQLALNEFGSTLANGSYMAAFPPIFSEGTFMGQHVPQYRAGEVQRQEFGGGINQVDIRFNGGYIPQLMIEIDRRADLVARISTNASGGQFRGNPTATEVAAIRTEQDAGLAEYVSQWGLGACQIAQLALLHYRLNYDLFKGVYGSDLQCEDATDLAKPVRWELNGKSAAHTSAIRLQQLLMLINMANDPAYGFDKYELGKAFLEASSLANVRTIQIPKEVALANKKLAELMAGLGGTGGGSGPTGSSEGSTANVVGLGGL